mgnify:CR=1 FL=1
MLHPVFRVLMRRPELVLDHLAGYAELLREQARSASGQLVSRALAWAVAVLGFLMFIVLAGVSAMLHAVLGHSHWMLWLVPGVVGGSEEYTPIRALGNVFLTYAVGLFLGRYLSDALNGFKAFRRDVFDSFSIRNTGGHFALRLGETEQTLQAANGAGVHRNGRQNEDGATNLG